MGLWSGCLGVLATWGVLLTAGRAPPGSVWYECEGGSVRVAVRQPPRGPALHPRSLRLGSCPLSSSEGPRGLLRFHYKMRDCGFSRLVSGDVVEHFADLRYRPPDGQGSYYSSPFVERISCVSRGGRHAAPGEAAPARGQLSAVGVLPVSVALLNALGAPPEPPRFPLGSRVRLVFAVERGCHQPLQVFVDECVATATPELRRSRRKYAIVTNHGCLVESKVAKSYYVPRAAPEVLELSLQAFEFVGAGSDIYLHCRVVVWDPARQADATRKACSFRRDTGRWELLDDPFASSVCDCCDHQCPGTGWRARRDLLREEPSAAWDGVLDEEQLAHTVLIGPLRVQGLAPGSGSTTTLGPTIPAAVGSRGG